MSSTSDLISEEGVMKNSPSKMSASSRLRKSPQGPNSIYVPPPLRKRKNSCDIKKNAPSISTEKCKVQDACTSVALHLNTLPISQTGKSKKCENSYLLFGLEDKSNQKPLDKPPVENEPKERLQAKDQSPIVKKCDNSYLLFGEDPEPSHFPENTTNDKLWKKQISNRNEGNDFHEQLPSRTAEALFSGAKHFESSIVPFLPDDLSCGVGSLSVNNRSIKTPVPSREAKPGRQPSQKKCDNSYFLFDDDDSDLKYGKTPFREKPQNTCLSLDRLPQPVSSDKPENSPTLPLVHSPGEERSNRAAVPVKTETLFSDEMSEDYHSIKPTEAQSPSNSGFEGSDNIEDYVVEIYDFPKSLRTQDMMTIFSVYVPDGFVIKWVDDTHALGVFSNPCLVSDVLKKKFDQVNVRALQSATPASIESASSIPVPSGSRPRTCPSLARRLVSGALGLRVSVSDETRRAEKKMLQEAKEERRLAAKQREQAWEGTLRSNLAT